MPLGSETANKPGEVLPGQLLTPREAADQLRLSVTAVYALCDSGALPCYRIGAKRGRRRIKASDLAAYLDQHQAPATPSAEHGRRRCDVVRGVGTAFQLLREAGWKG